MAELVLGPMLRHVDADAATIWVEADGPCEVTILGATEPTFEVEGHHFALVATKELAPGESTGYEVELDGETVWPPPGYPYPAPCIKPVAKGEGVRFIFGSCRVSYPNEEPWVLHQDEHPQGQGIDALRTLALGLVREQERPPDCLLMLGDQIYADDLSPELSEMTERRDESSPAPPDQLADFGEFARAYREAWSEPLIRWLLSTVPVAGDAGPLLREEMRNADEQASHSRWSYYRDLGDTRLLVIDSRAGRVLEPPERKMIQADEWRWIVEHAAGDFDHLLLGSSLPMFLTPGLHYIEAWDAQLADRGRTKATRRLGEKIRQTAVMDHWASFQSSYLELCELLTRIGEGGHGEGSAPKTIVILSGDVHHYYLAEVDLPDPPGPPPMSDSRSRIWQAVCLGYRKDLALREKRAMRVGNSRFGELAARGLARMAGIKRSPLDWHIVHEPSYDNQVASLELRPDVARIRVQTTVGSDWRDPDLHTVFEQDLLGRRGPPRRRLPARRTSSSA